MTAALLFLQVPSARCAGLSEVVGLDTLTGAAEAYLDGYLDVEMVTGDSFSGGVEAIVKAGGEELPGILRQAAGSGALLLAVALLCGLSESAGKELGGGELDPVRLAAVAAVTGIAVGDVNTLMGLGSQALERMDSFSALLLPTVTAACAAAGMPVSAAARQSATLLFFKLLLTLARQVVLPLVYAYVAASAAHAALGNDGLKRVAGLIKWGATGLLSMLLTGFIFYLTIAGGVAGGADALALKTAKTAISGMVPVVGGILSDAAETVVAGAGVLKGTVGVVGLLTVLAICLVPFLQLGCHYLIYKFTAALSATVTAGPAAGLMDAIGSAFALVLGMVGGEALILYVALITSIQAVSTA